MDQSDQISENETTEAIDIEIISIEQFVRLLLSPKCQTDPEKRKNSLIGLRMMLEHAMKIQNAPQEFDYD